VAGILILLLLAVVAVGFWALWRPVKLTQPAIVDIRSSTSFGYVARSLQKRGLIPNATIFKIYARLTRQSTKLKVGEYEVTNGMRPVDTLQALVNGRARAYWLTIPEGKWVREVDALVAGHWPQAAGEFSTLAAQPQRWQGKVPFPLPTGSLEGYLFPDTYRFTRDVTAEMIITAMLQRLAQTCWAAYQAHPPADGRSFHDVLVLASLVEAEARRDNERAVIAGVYMNRVQRRMTLDCDATLIYARQERVRRVLNIDKEIISPYNTYRTKGLPPGPINNPGLASFNAALQPKTVTYLYYVARGDGSHIFSETLHDQGVAIRQVRGQ
ncbi:MAG TPA: endolytic transglycosylase MltG, partial [Armatimonadota bacterium]